MTPSSVLRKSFPSSLEEQPIDSSHGSSDPYRSHFHSCGSRETKFGPLSWKLGDKTWPSLVEAGRQNLALPNNQPSQLRHVLKILVFIGALGVEVLMIKSGFVCDILMISVQIDLTQDQIHQM